MTTTPDNPIDHARGLMRGDPKTFKAGYTAESAVLATAEFFKLDRDAALKLANEVDANEAVVKACLE